MKPGHAAKSEAKGLAKGASGAVGQVYEHALHGFVFKGSAKGAAATQEKPECPLRHGRRSNEASRRTASRMASADQRQPSDPARRPPGAFPRRATRIAILDTGLYLDHPDLEASLDPGLNCMTDPPGATPPDDDHGHGTHVAGIDLLRSTTSAS